MRVGEETVQPREPASVEARQPKDTGGAGDLRSSTTTAKPASPTPESADPDLGRSDLTPTTAEDDPAAGEDSGQGRDARGWWKEGREGREGG